jgi:sec-independent protein translocase protein TatA
MLGGLGPMELIVVLVIILIVFGAGKLPDIASGLGKGIRDFKKGMKDLEQEDGEPSTTDRNEKGGSSPDHR